VDVNEKMRKVVHPKAMRAVSGVFLGALHSAALIYADKLPENI
jgi:hypothetical protein